MNQVNFIKYKCDFCNQPKTLKQSVYINANTMLCNTCNLHINLVKKSRNLNIFG